MKLQYSLIIEATDDPDFFGFYSPDLKGFSGTGTSVADCLNKAEIAMREHIEFLQEAGLPVPEVNKNAIIRIEHLNREIPAA